MPDKAQKQIEKERDACLNTPSDIEIGGKPYKYAQLSTGAQKEYMQWLRRRNRKNLRADMRAENAKKHYVIIALRDMAAPTLMDYMGSLSLAEGLSYALALSINENGGDITPEAIEEKKRFGITETEEISAVLIGSDPDEDPDDDDDGDEDGPAKNS